MPVKLKIILNPCANIRNFTYNVFITYINTDFAIFPPEIWVEFLVFISQTANTFKIFYFKHNGMFNPPNIISISWNPKRSTGNS